MFLDLKGLYYSANLLFIDLDDKIVSYKAKNEGIT